MTDDASLTYLAYARTGKEFEVEQELREMGIDLWCGRKIEFRRSGKRRFFDPKEEPALPNYLFLSLTAGEWHEVNNSGIKYLAKTMHTLSRRDEKGLKAFRVEVGDLYQRARRIVDSNDRAAMCRFNPGDKISLRAESVFSGQVLSFRRMVQRASDMHPMVEAEMESLGRLTKVLVDPLDVKA